MTRTTAGGSLLLTWCALLTMSRTIPKPVTIGLAFTPQDRPFNCAHIAYDCDDRAIIKKKSQLSTLLRLKSKPIEIFNPRTYHVLDMHSNAHLVH